MSQTHKRRVAAYARVSTDKEEQLNSYKAQVEYYKKYIQNNDEWEYVDVYADEGITGTSTKSRKRCQEMIDDAVAGKIDLNVGFDPDERDVREALAEGQRVVADQTKIFDLFQHGRVRDRLCGSGETVDLPCVKFK